MKYLRISNKNELDPKGLVLLGGTNKRNDPTKIGVFGSGWKYALAYLLRTNHKVVIYSGPNRIKISKKPETFRGLQVEVIHINGQPTSLTTSAGPRWDLWEAIRELWANALDEGGAQRKAVETLEPAPAGTTHVYIELSNELEAVLEDWNEYFVGDRKVLWENENFQIFETRTGFIGYSGARCVPRDQSRRFALDYNIHPRSNVAVSEDRRLSLSSAFTISRLLRQCTSEKVFKILFNQQNPPEDLQHFNVFCLGKSDRAVERAWKESRVCCPRHKILHPEIDFSAHGTIPNDLYDRLFSEFGPSKSSKIDLGLNTTEWKVHEFSERERQKLSQVLAHLKTLGLEIPYEIVRVIFPDPGTIAQVDILGGRILLGERAFNSFRSLTIAVLEEYTHLKYGCKDHTREMQNALHSVYTELLGLHTTHFKLQENL